MKIKKGKNYAVACSALPASWIRAAPPHSLPYALGTGIPGAEISSMADISCPSMLMSPRKRKKRVIREKEREKRREGGSNVEDERV